MSERPFMQLYVSDYLGDTRHLSCEQHGAYMLLLMTMWNANGALPDDDAKLARIVCLSVKKWRAIRDDVLAFFSVEEGLITSDRLSKELQKSESKSQSRAAAGAEGGRAKALKDKEARLANARVLPQHLPDTITRKNRDANASLERDTQFDQIWTIYPRKVGKTPARKKFDQALKVADFDTILAGVVRYADERRGEDHSFTKHLATWFGGCHWQDEPAPPRSIHATSPPRNRKPNAFDAYEAICRERGWKPDEPDFIPSPDSDVERLPAERGEHAGALVDFREGADWHRGSSDH